MYHTAQVSWSPEDAGILSYCVLSHRAQGMAQFPLVPQTRTVWGGPLLIQGDMKVHVLCTQLVGQSFLQSGCYLLCVCVLAHVRVCHSMHVGSADSCRSWFFSFTVRLDSGCQACQQMPLPRKPAMPAHFHPPSSVCRTWLFTWMLGTTTGVSPCTASTFPNESFP